MRIRYIILIFLFATEIQAQTIWDLWQENSGIPKIFFEPTDRAGISLNLPSNPTMVLRRDMGVTSADGIHITNWADQSGNGYDESQSDTTLTPYLLSNLLYFKSRYMATTVQPFLGDMGSQYTISAWIYLDTFVTKSSYIPIVMGLGYYSGNRIQIRWQADDITFFNAHGHYDTASSNTNISYTGYSVSNMQHNWVCVQGVWDRANLYIYIDGNVNSTSENNGTSATANYQLLIGGVGYYTYVSSIVLYKRALTVPELTQLRTETEKLNLTP